MTFDYTKAKDMVTEFNAGYTAMKQAVAQGNANQALAAIKTAVTKAVTKGPGGNEENADYFSSLFNKFGVYQKLQFVLDAAKGPVVSAAQTDLAITKEVADLEGIVTQTAFEKIPAQDEQNRPAEKSLAQFRIEAAYDALKRLMVQPAPAPQGP